MAEEVDEQRKRKAAALFSSSMCPITFGSAPRRKTVRVQASPFCHLSKQGKLQMAFSPFYVQKTPGSFFFPRPLLCRDILNTPIRYGKASHYPGVC